MSPQIRKKHASTQYKYITILIHTLHVITWQLGVHVDILVGWLGCLSSEDTCSASPVEVGLLVPLCDHRIVWTAVEPLSGGICVAGRGTANLTVPPRTRKFRSAIVLLYILLLYCCRGPVAIGPLPPSSFSPKPGKDRKDRSVLALLGMVLLLHDQGCP